MFTRSVQYYETDMMGIAHHANYVHWMEEARIDFMDHIGYPYARMEAEGVMSPVRSLSVQYKKPCTFGDKVAIDVSVEAFNGVVMTLRYRMTRAETLLCEARSEHVFVDRQGRLLRVKRDMPEFCEIIEQLMKSEAAGD